MTASLKTLIAAGLTALSLAGGALVAAAPAQASDWAGYEDDDDDFPRYRRHWRERRFYGRPVYEGPVYGRPVYGRPVYGRPVYRGGCRVIVKRRIDEWGDVTVRRLRVCD